jgi:short-subunit dehydrogenase
MNEHFMGLTFITLAVLGIGAVYGNLWARRVRDFLPVARNRERLVDLAKEIDSKNVDEMLVAIPGGSTANLSNTADVLVQYLPPKLLSPFGDW